jgi:PPE-repeat protein
MDFGALPPEINSARMYAGPGAGPLLAAATAWDSLATELESAASTYSSVVAGLTSGRWLGPSSLSMASAFAPYVAWTAGAGTQAAAAASQAKLAVEFYGEAFAMTVPPPVVTANRVQLASLIATNLFGQNSAAIAATEAQYVEMWAQDAMAMYQYAATSAEASTLTPFTSAPEVTSPVGLASQGVAVSQVTGTAAAQQISLTQLMTSLPGALQGLATPASGTTGLSGMLAGLTSSLSPASFLSSIEGLPGQISSSDWISLAPSWLMTSMTPLYGLSSVLGMAQTMQGMASTAAQGVAAAVADVAADTAGAASAGADALGGGVLGSLGQAASLGPLSVPAGWTSVIPTAQLASAGAALQNGGMGALSHVPPSVLGGLPRAAANGAGPAAGPRYGLIPTVMAQPPSAGYGAIH